MTDSSLELTKNVIVNYKDITSWILLGIILIFAYVNYRKDAALAEKIESFKAELTKKEIKFTRHSELQIECLKNLYDLVVTLHFSFVNLSNPPYKKHELLQKQIETFQSDFDKTITFTHRNKILLTDEITAQIRIVHDKYRKIYEVCREEIFLLLSIQEFNDPTNTYYLYITTVGEEKFIKGRIENLNKNPDIQTFEADLLKLRELIENYFKTLVS